MERHSSQLNTKGSRINKRGFVLMLTLMMLVLITSVIVNFQADTTLHVRASTFRQDYVQCRYAAESGMIAGKFLVIELLTDRKALTAIKPGSSQKKKTIALDPNALDDPNTLDDLIKNILADPNALEFEEAPLEEKSQRKMELLLKEKRIQVGKADVLVQIFDETGKLPMMWVAQSPYIGTKDPDLLKNLGNYLGAPPATSRRAKKIADDISKPLNIPAAFNSVQQDGSRTSSSRRATSSSQQQWKVRGLRLSSKKRAEHSKQRYDSMASFASTWNREVQPDTDNDVLLEPLNAHPGAFSDYLGTWGHDKVNINTAPVEVLEAALKPLGVTRAMAEKIVTLREEKPIGHPTALRQFDEFEALIPALVALTMPLSNTFTIRVTATLGRTEYTLFSAVYKSPFADGGIMTQAIYAGE